MSRRSRTRCTVESLLLLAALLLIPAAVATAQVTVPCGQSPAPQCGGVCAPGETCTPDPVGCHCAVPTIPCDQGAAPQCGGACPANAVCKANSVTGHCSCVDVAVPCGQSPFPAVRRGLPGRLRLHPELGGPVRVHAAPAGVHPEPVPPVRRGLPGGPDLQDDPRHDTVRLPGHRHPLHAEPGAAVRRRLPDRARPASRTRPPVSATASTFPSRARRARRRSQEGSAPRARPAEPTRRESARATRPRVPCEPEPGAAMRR